MRSIRIAFQIYGNQNKGGKSVKKGCTGSDGNKRVHIRRTPENCLDSAGKIFSVD